MLSREELLSDADLKREEVQVADLGTVLMREMTVAELTSAQERFKGLREGLTQDEGDLVMSLALVALCICNPDGSAMFAEDELAEAVGLLKRKSRRAWRDLQEGFARLNGASEAEIEEAVGNLSEITNGSGPSESPVISDTPAPAR